MWRGRLRPGTPLLPGCWDGRLSYPQPQELSCAWVLLLFCFLLTTSSEFLQNSPELRVGPEDGELSMVLLHPQLEALPACLSHGWPLQALALSGGGLLCLCVSVCWSGSGGLCRGWRASVVLVQPQSWVGLCVPGSHRWEFLSGPLWSPHGSQSLPRIFVLVPGRSPCPSCCIGGFNGERLGLGPFLAPPPGYPSSTLGGSAPALGDSSCYSSAGSCVTCPSHSDGHSPPGRSPSRPRPPSFSWAPMEAMETCLRVPANSPWARGPGSSLLWASPRSHSVPYWNVGSFSPRAWPWLPPPGLSHPPVFSVLGWPLPSDFRLLVCPTISALVCSRKGIVL